MPRLPIKKTQKLAEAKEYGETLGRLRAEKKFRDSAKGQERSLEGHFGKWFDNMAAKVDPIELAAMGATTFLVHEALLGVEAVTNELVNLSKHPEQISGVIKAIIPEPFPGNPLLSWSGFFASLFPAAAPQQATPTAPPAPKDSLMLWVISFLIAFIIIRFGPAIIQSLGGIAGIAKTLLSVGVVAAP